MQIQKLNDITFLKMETLGDKKLNPFLANINHIRYIREYHFNSEEDTGYAVFVGEKMLVTKDPICSDEKKILSEIKGGDSFSIGDVKFKCVFGGGLADDKKHKYYINLNNAYHIRTYIDGNGKNNQLAIITVDGRVIPVDELEWE